MSKREVPLFPDSALLARERGARSSRERPAVTLLTLLRVGGLGLRPRHACNRSPPDLRPVAGRKKSLSALSPLIILENKDSQFPSATYIDFLQYVCVNHVFPALPTISSLLCFY